MVVPKLDMEKLKNQDRLTPDDEDNLQREIHQELFETPEQKKEREAQEAEGKEITPETEAKALTERAVKLGLPEDVSKEEVEAKEKEAPKPETDEEKTAREKKEKEEKETADAQTKADEAILAKKEEDLDDEEKARKVEILKAKEEAKPKEPTAEEKKALETEEKALIAGIVKTEGVSEEEAKQLLEKDRAVLEQHKGSALEVARAYRNIQSKAAKDETTLKDTQSQLQQANQRRVQEQKVTVDDVVRMISEGGVKDEKGNSIPEATVIAGYKDQYPTVTKDLEDEEVLKLAAEKVLDAHNRGRETFKTKQTTDATAKRTELIADLSDDAKEFSEAIKDVLGKSSDAQVLSPAFNLEDIIRWARGDKKVYDTLVAKIETARTEGYEKGKEEARVLGVKSPIDKEPKAPQPSKLARELNDREKTRALEMFDGQQMTDEDKFKSYIEIHPKGEPGVRELIK